MLPQRPNRSLFFPHRKFQLAIQYIKHRLAFIHRRTLLFGQRNDPLQRPVRLRRQSSHLRSESVRYRPPAWFWYVEDIRMCRSIKPLFNFDPPVTEEEIRAASLQFVRKISGFHRPSKGNETPFLAAVDQISAVAANLLNSLATSAPPKDREAEAAKARARIAGRMRQ